MISVVGNLAFFISNLTSHSQRRKKKRKTKKNEKEQKYVFSLQKSQHSVHVQHALSGGDPRVGASDGQDLDLRVEVEPEDDSSSVVDRSIHVDNDSLRLTVGQSQKSGQSAKTKHHY